MNNYKLRLNLNESTTDLIQPNQEVLVINPYGQPNSIPLRISQRKEVSSGKTKSTISGNFKKLFNALTIPLVSTSARSLFLQTILVYWFLSASRISTFFVRGWRLEIIRNMLRGKRAESNVAPTVSRLPIVGSNIRQGVILIGAKLIYDLPKIIIITAIGYSYIEYIIEWATFFFTRTFGSSTTTFGEMLSDTSFKAGRVLIFQLLFIIVYSVLVTPAFKITEIKYASGKISFWQFFNLSELKDSYRLYKQYKSTTIQVYAWDKLITLISYVFGFGFIVFTPFFYFLIFPAYKLVFKHWPKAYGYGLLARKLRDDGHIPDLVAS